MSWTAEELAVLKRAADEGLSSGTIASRLPGKSRNAVIGMLRRGDGKYGRLLGQPVNQARGRATPMTGQPPKRRYKPARTIVPVAPPIAAASPVEIHFTSPPCTHFTVPAKVEAPANVAAVVPIPFLQAVMTDCCLHFACSWDAPDGPDMPVCGAERARDVPHTRYCRRHLASERQSRVAA
ncbi:MULTISPECIES: GcrA family cell cycle regulator [unclassified Mesorhizobium]|uniref:GcrA family cell cycle regulator n=1 Tax=unclassified Mesorhizobium TaxID=325217 RepID=UPI00112AF8D8|nr:MULTISPECIES: GcrA family cell cycle regulator [unclassified Mesorhizobium]MCA0027365.1 hypothetical protein [Mesorhizobium sp. B263B1A]TPJ98639.1 hypothetical protein FJ489_06845 [Mesorhizobium sp. B2-5-12]TPK28802.1 hypothetical protein FJ562_00235 [Mesorhizobium sp. B2-5-6]